MQSNTIRLKGRVLVSDVLVALEPMLTEEVMTPLDVALEGRRDDRLMFDDVEVDVAEALDTLDDSDDLPKGEDLACLLDESDVRGLAEAIRCGDRETAELLLDRMFGDVPDATTIREWIERGRYSRKARQAIRKPSEPLRSVA